MLRAVHVDDIGSEAGYQPGALERRELDGTIAGFAFRCPCGCGVESWLPVNGEWAFNGWEWNGDRDRPTLKPSVLNRACGWHGFLTDGEWREC